MGARHPSFFSNLNQHDSLLSQRRDAGSLQGKMRSLADKLTTYTMSIASQKYRQEYRYGQAQRRGHRQWYLA